MPSSRPVSVKVQTLRPQSGTPPRAPEAIRNGNVVIVGAGPTGLLTALLLNERGVRSTIIERMEDIASFEVARAYPVSLIKRGATILDGVPGLREAVQAKCIPSGLDSAYQVSADGSLGPFGFSFASNKELFGLRSSYVNPLYERVLKTEGITMIHGTELINMTFQKDGSIDLELMHKGEKQHMTSQLVLGCDGRSSKTLRLLRKAAETGDVKNSHGFGEISVESGASTRQRKTLLMNNAVEELLPKELAPDVKTASSVLLRSPVDMPAERALMVYAVPMLKAEVERCGGRLASVIQPPGHEIWRVETVDEAFALLRENFPSVDFEKLVSRSNMQRFLDTEPRSYGLVRRTRSLVGTARGAGAGSGGGCGVVLLGDAAHSFPPVMALGLNSAFEDVGVLMRLVDDAAGGDGAAAVAERYECARLADVKALTTINATVPFFGPKNSSPVTLAGRFLDWAVRTPLAKRWPDSFQPNTLKLILADAPFSEVTRRKRAATQRVLAVFAGVVATVGVVVGKVVS